MHEHRAIPPSAVAILAIVEIKAATEAFDRGEANVFEALDAIAAAAEAARGVIRAAREAA